MKKLKVPGKVSPQSLENAAVYYLKRYSSSSSHLKSILLRRVIKSARYHGTDIEEGKIWIDNLVKEFQKAGFLNDQKYAETRAHSLYARGFSSRAIMIKLSEKGVPAKVISETLKIIQRGSGNSELQAAIIKAKRRKLGPYRTRGDRQTHRKKDLESLARVGFNYGTALKVIDAWTEDELEDCLVSYHI